MKKKKKGQPWLASFTYCGAWVAAIELIMLVSGYTDPWHDFLVNAQPYGLIVFFLAVFFRWMAVDAEIALQKKTFDETRKGTKRYRRPPPNRRNGQENNSDDV